MNAGDARREDGKEHPGRLQRKGKISFSDEGKMGWRLLGRNNRASLRSSPCNGLNIKLLGLRLIISHFKGRRRGGDLKGRLDPTAAKHPSPIVPRKQLHLIQRSEETVLGVQENGLFPDVLGERPRSSEHLQ